MSNVIRVEEIGVEKNPVYIVDDFYPDIDELLASADCGERFLNRPEDYYPGIKKPLVSQQYRQLLESYQSTLSEVFKLFDEPDFMVERCDYAISNTPPEKLLPIQSIPHFDTADKRQIAAVHYLCGPQHGGTSFYRHRATRFESVCPDSVNKYQGILGRQATTDGLPSPGYITGDTALFSRIRQIKAKFNRIIFYRSSVLHSGDITPAKVQASNIYESRLTIVSHLIFS